MDLNDYYFRQLFSQLQADRARTDEARSAYQERADTYARLIWEEQRRRGATIATLGNKPGQEVEQSMQPQRVPTLFSAAAFLPLACA